ncbi:hypothetical protein BKA65DRAFT_580853 [Rhexocercosporidium sp. MPI-PUGE-AT-0058]|nr:hypothetical protein BKA65DRAFT_580853 [Rhexocercosporidium sp. MPI-PUGE-AT-0058]
MKCMREVGRKLRRNLPLVIGWRHELLTELNNIYYAVCSHAATSFTLSKNRHLEGADNFDVVVREEIDVRVTRRWHLFNPRLTNVLGGKNVGRNIGGNECAGNALKFYSSFDWTLSLKETSYWRFYPPPHLGQTDGTGRSSLPSPLAPPRTGKVLLKILTGEITSLLLRQSFRKIPQKADASGEPPSPQYDPTTASRTKLVGSAQEPVIASLAGSGTRNVTTSQRASTAATQPSKDENFETDSPSVVSVDNKVTSETGIDELTKEITTWQYKVGSESPVPSEIWTTRMTGARSSSTVSYTDGHSAVALFERHSSSESTYCSAFLESDPSERRMQMDRFIDLWQMESDGNKTANLSEESDGEGMARSYRDILGPSIQRSRHVPLPWTTACLAADCAFKLNSMTKPNRLGIIEIVAKMEWYIGFSHFLSEQVGKPTTHPRKLRGMMKDLCLVILTYTIEQSVQWNRRDWMEPVTPHDFAKRHILSKEAALLRELTAHEVQVELSQLLDSIKVKEETLTPVITIPAEDESLLKDLKSKLQPIPHLNLIGMTRSSSFYCCRVLWVFGVPGAGKTMLMRATMQSLLKDAEAKESSITDEFNLVYFFCDSRSRPHGYVTQVLKSLIWQILERQPALAKHVYNKFSSTQRDKFDDPNDFYAMSTVLYSMLNDPNFRLTYVIIDAAEELYNEDAEAFPRSEQKDLALGKLLKLVVKSSQLSSDSPRMKWLVSVDKDRVNAELTSTNGTTQMNLDMDNPRYLQDLQVVAKEYISAKVAKLAEASSFGENSRDQITELMQMPTTTPRNFLWVNLACSHIEADGIPWNADKLLSSLPHDIPSLYDHMYKMLDKIDSKEDHIMCHDILFTTAIAYRSLRILEVESLVGIREAVDLKVVVKKMCRFFLEIQDGCVCYIHPSAREFVQEKLTTDNKLSSRHLLMTEECLRQAIASYRSKSNTYALIYWVRHFCNVHDETEFNRAILAASKFFDDYFLEWVEILVAEGLLSHTIVLLEWLTDFLKKKKKVMRPPTKEESYYLTCLKNVQDSLWLLNFHQSIKGPEHLGPKNSLPFLPSKSELRKNLLPKALPWLETAPDIGSSVTLGRAIHILEGHGDWVRCCRYSPDGRIIASGGDDGVVRLWDAETTKVQHIFELTGYVLRVLFARDQLMIALGGSTIRMWDSSTGTQLQDLDTEGDIAHIDISPDGESLVAAKGNVLVIWKVPADPKAQKWAEPTLLDVKLGNEKDSDIKSVKFSPDGSWLAYTHSSDVFLYGLDSKKDRRFGGHTEEGHENYVNSVSFSKDRSRLASGSSDDTIRIWKLSTDKTFYEIEKILLGHTGTVFCLRFAPEGRRLISSSADEAVRIWDVDTEQEVATAQEETGQPPMQPPDEQSNPISFVAFSPNGNVFASASTDGKICLWNGDTGRPLGTVKEHDAEIMSLAFSQDGSTLVSASKDYTVRVWDTTADTIAIKQHLLGHSDWVRCDVPSSDGTVVAPGSDDNSVKVWNISTLPPLSIESATQENDADTRYRSFNGHSRFVYSVTFSPKMGYVASGGDDGILIWSLKGDGDQEEPETTLKGDFRSRTRGLAFTGDEKRIVSCEVSGNVRIWNLEAKICERVLTVDGWLFKTIRFDVRSPGFLITEIGAWNIVVDEPPSVSASSSDITESPEEAKLTRATLPSWCLYGISDNREWITWNGKELLFIPAQYRPYSYDRVVVCIGEHKVAIGCDSGQVLFFKFSKESPQL